MIRSFDENVDGGFDLRVVTGDGVVYALRAIAVQLFEFFRCVLEMQMQMQDMESDGIITVDLTHVDRVPKQVTRQSVWYCLAFAHWAPNAAPTRPSGEDLKVTLDFLGAEDVLCKIIDDHISPPLDKIDVRGLGVREAIEALAPFSRLDRYIRPSFLSDVLRAFRERGTSWASS